MKVLLTGPSGRLGPHLVTPFRKLYDLRTFDLKPSEDPNSFVGDLTEIEPLREAMRGVEVVVHLAAISDEAPFVEKLVPSNVVGVYNVLEAARLENVRRVVFASSIQAVGRNAGDKPVETHEPPRPSTLYGATKVLAEVMGRFYHDKHGLEFIAIRLGAFETYDSPAFRHDWLPNIWLSPRDAISLFQASIEKPGIGYAVVNGTSNTPQERLSLREAREILGWQPQDDPSQIERQTV